MTSRLPPSRISLLNDAPPHPAADFVLYWMVSSRRTRYNFALQRAIELAAELRKPVLVLEALRCDYPWASGRLHRFIAGGMAQNARACAAARVAYYPYIEPQPGAAKGLLTTLAHHAAAVVTDDYPAFFLPRAVSAAATQLNVRFEAVDSNGLLPMRTAGRAFSTALSFRRYLQASLPAYLAAFPAEDPLAGNLLPQAAVPPGVVTRWPPLDTNAIEATIAGLPIDHRIPPVRPGGQLAALDTLESFLSRRLASYAADRNHPDLDGGSNLSPYLHFGHLSVHEVLARLATLESWSPASLAPRPTGSRSGWWGMTPSAEAFLDELITWRELGFNACAATNGWDRYESLPAWARATLDRHSSDPRQHLYDLPAFEAAETHDPVWNAAQVQLLREGRIHNYMRMLWGKKILEWSASPRDALAIMIHLNNKYALDGRDPNSYTGILWVLGKYDRPWAPERPVFGTVRYMSSANTLRKLRAREYVKRYAP